MILINHSIKEGELLGRKIFPVGCPLDHSGSLATECQLREATCLSPQPCIPAIWGTLGYLVSTFGIWTRKAKLTSLKDILVLN
ncbi:hypothetical protein LENED_006951 [Lentinula edodes]|uniref:Uncharacterized protein n=1 Tax=Lentinula edodes TaxID=5353 RepID=A0A1Q3ED33_LENED|nr:hypothetical protein LENED_006951 [Lentinula edodes]